MNLPCAFHHEMSRQNRDPPKKTASTTGQPCFSWLHGIIRKSDTLSFFNFKLVEITIPPFRFEWHDGGIG
jgi:hypothetical protein